MAQFQLSKDEYIRGSLAFTLKRRTIVLLVIAFASFVASLVFNGNSFGYALVFCSLWAIGLLAVLYGLVRFRLSKIYREQQSLQELINVTIDDQQLSYVWPRGTYVLPWANVRRGRETRNFFILWESIAFGRMLPKRALSQEEQAIIRKNIASKSRK